LLDEQGRVTSANLLFLRVVGRRMEETAGRSFFRDLESFAESGEVESTFREDVVRAGRSVSLVVDVHDASDGQPVLTKIHVRPVVLKGAVSGLVVLDPGSSHGDLQSRIQQLEDRLNALAWVRHEISNSLMGLLGNLELLESRPDLKRESRERVEAIHAESHRISERLGDLNRLSQD
jgi:signal transduction histidine kinase